MSALSPVSSSGRIPDALLRVFTENVRTFIEVKL